MAPRTTRRAAAAAKKSAGKTANTRSKGTAAAAPDDNDTEDSQTQLADAAPPEAPHPNPKAFILPSHHDPATPAAMTVITLPHPSTQAPTHYLLHSALGLHEIKKLSYPLSTPRSWLVTPDTAAKPPPSATSWVQTGQTIPDSTLYLCTPFDPLFLLAAHFTKTPSPHFLPRDDILDALVDAAPHWALLLKPDSKPYKQTLARIRAICDAVDAAGETSYRLSQPKLLDVLARKCARMAEHPLPPSLEDEFVRKPLANPLGSAPALTTTTTTTTDDQPPLAPSPSPPPSLAPLSLSPSPPSPTITHLQRLLTSLTHLSTYLPPPLTTLLTTHLHTTHPTIPLLTAHLASLAALKSHLAFTRAGDFTQLRGDERDEMDSRRKRKREEEEEGKRRLKGRSQGVKALGKVNTSGMAKMTSFFGKKGG